MGVPNSYHASRWELVMSNIPTIGTEKINKDIYNLYVKGVTIPDLTINMIYSDYKDYTYLNPGTRGNTELMQLMIEFVLSEDAKNYYNFFNLLMQTRFDVEEGKKLKDLNINGIVVYFKDNQKRKKSKMTFKNCFLSNLSSLPLIHGSSEEITFTATFNYQEVLYDLVT